MCPKEKSFKSRIFCDLIIFVDTTWSYRTIVDYVNYVIQHVNVEPFGSSVTILSALDGKILVNRTFHVTDVYENWNSSSHLKAVPGFNLPHILNKIIDLIYLMDESSWLTERSIITVIVPSPLAFVSDYDSEYCQKFLHKLYKMKPDLEFLYFSGGAMVRFKDFVKNDEEDLFYIYAEEQPEYSGLRVIQRIEKVPRRLSCDGQELKQYLDLDYTNFYRLSSLHFFSENPKRFLTFKPISPLTFTICVSRTISLPHRNLSSSEQNCQQISQSIFNYDLSELCLNYNKPWECPPVYLSIQSQKFADLSQISCTDFACQTPKQTEYFLIMNNFDCVNMSRNFLPNFYLIVLMIVFLRN